MSKVRLIASDMDGTVLFDAHARRLPTEALAAAERALDAGVVFVAASGRQHYNVRNLFGELADRIVYVCENGTLAINGSETLYQAPVDRERLFALSRAVLATEKIHLMLSGVHACYVSVADQLFYERMRDGLGNLTYTFDSLEGIDDYLVKAGIWFADAADPKALAEVEQLKRDFGEEFELVSSGVDWYDIVVAGQNKAVALAAVGEALGIDASEMAAFGDNYNDAPMLSYVGHPYLMETGKPELRGLNERLRLCKSVPDTIDELLAANGE